MARFDENRFKSEIMSCLVVDQSRQEFINETSSTLYALCSGSLRECSRFRKLLIGTKGVGKSRLLKAISSAAQLASKGYLIACEIEYKQGKFAVLPSVAIWESFPLHAKLHHVFASRDYSMAGLNKTLRDLDIRMLITVDDLEQVYSTRFTEGKEIIDQLYGLANLDGGAIHCILSGDSSSIRLLAYGEMDRYDKDLYPNYTGVKLNSQKFSTIWIYPFCLAENDFKAAVIFMSKHVNQRESSSSSVRASLSSESNDELSSSTMISPLSSDAMDSLLVETGGNISSLEYHFLNKTSTPHVCPVSSQEFLFQDCEERTILVTIFEKLRFSLPKADLCTMYDWVKMMPCCTVFREIGPKKRLAIHTLADLGIIRHKEGFLEEIGFGTPLIFQEVDMYLLCTKAGQVFQRFSLDLEKLLRDLLEISLWRGAHDD